MNGLAAGLGLDLADLLASLDHLEIAEKVLLVGDGHEEGTHAGVFLGLTSHPEETYRSLFVDPLTQAQLVLGLHKQVVRGRLEGDSHLPQFLIGFVHVVHGAQPWTVLGMIFR